MTGLLSRWFTVPAQQNVNLIDWRIARDWMQILRQQPVETILDVGAHTGESARLFRHHFPQSTVYAFEPSARPYASLADAAAADPQIWPVPAAVGEIDGRIVLRENHAAETNSILTTAPDVAEYAEGRNCQPLCETVVPITRLDTFCHTRELYSIDLLKIDVQGYEAQVLAGCGALLYPRTIRSLFLELLFVDAYQGQTPAWSVLQLLEARGYRLFGMTNIGADEQHGWKFADAMFIAR